MNARVVSLQEYRHLFNAGVGDGPLTAIGLGFYHSFTILKLEGEMYLVIEKFDDRLEVMLGEGANFLAYCQRFRATLDERPVSSNRPLQICPQEVLIKDVRVANVCKWIAGPLAMIWQPYSLLAQNCQSFARDLRNYLMTGADVADALRHLRSNKVIVMDSVRRDELLLAEASDELKKDHDIVIAACPQNGEALQHVPESLKHDETIVMAAAERN